MLRKVLLVEDHDSLRCLLGKFLSEKFDVVSARDGLEAMSWLSTGMVPDVIVTDHDMPEMNGAELLNQLRCTGLWSKIPVVVLGTDDAQKQDYLYFKTLGAQHFFKKPFSPIALQEKLLQLIEAH